MCLQIYIKEYSSWSLSYVPDAKAVTDAPPNLMILMKQRRRWMNGALFGTAKVLGNYANMVSCRRNKQPTHRQCGMLILMTYMLTVYVLQFFLIGSMFATICVFWNNFFIETFARSGIPFFVEMYKTNAFFFGFMFTYMGLLFMTAAVSLSLPI